MVVVFILVPVNIDGTTVYVVVATLGENGSVCFPGMIPLLHLPLLSVSSVVPVQQISTLDKNINLVGY